MLSLQMADQRAEIRQQDAVRSARAARRARRCSTRSTKAACPRRSSRIGCCIVKAGGGKRKLAQMEHTRELLAPDRRPRRIVRGRVAPPAARGDASSSSSSRSARSARSPRLVKRTVAIGAEAQRACSTLRRSRVGSRCAAARARWPSCARCCRSRRARAARRRARHPPRRNGSRKAGVVVDARPRSAAL